MNNKKTLIILIAVLAAVIAGAAILYNTLGDKLSVGGFETVGGGTQAEDNGSTEAEGSKDSNEEVKTTDSADSSTDEPDKTLAPDFTVYDKDGKSVKLSDYFGKPIVLNFWASWCGPCKSEMPEFNEVFLEYKDDIVFLMVNMTDGQRETVEKASSYVQKEGYSFTVLYDTAYDAANTYNVSSLPTTYIIDKDGNLSGYAIGAISKEALLDGISRVYPVK